MSSNNYNYNNYNNNNSQFFDPLGVVQKQAHLGRRGAEMEVLSVLGNLSLRLFTDAVEIKTLGKRPALVVFKEHLVSHLYAHNVELLELLEKKFGR